MLAVCFIHQNKLMVIIKSNQENSQNTIVSGHIDLTAVGQIELIHGNKEVSLCKLK